MTGFRQIDHTADLALQLWAPSEAELLQVGARAIVSTLTGGADVRADASRPVSVDALDAEDRLVQWLNEIIYAAVTDGFVTASADIELGATSLTATLHGEADAAAKVETELKSVTYHDLKLEHTDAGWRAQIVIDV